MRTKINFCGIFAIAFIAATIILISSCSQDDDFYESDKYTMAEELETRTPEPGGGGSDKPSKIKYSKTYKGETYTFFNGKVTENVDFHINFDAADRTFSDLGHSIKSDNNAVNMEEKSYFQIIDGDSIFINITLVPTVSGGRASDVNKSFYIKKSDFK